jgi:hypothetical protein
MKNLLVRITLPLVCLLLLAHSPDSHAQGIPPSGPQAAGIFAVAIAVPVAVGIGVYYAVRAPRHIEGCVAGQGGKLELLDDKRRAYLLSGQVAAIKPNQRVGLSGKPCKDAMKRRLFLVKKVSRDFGPCQPASSAP